MSSRIYTLCGRIHLGPVVVNGGDKGQAICEACGGNVTREDREQIQGSWNIVRDMLSRYKTKESKR